jgi:hypothetical protein
MINLDSIFKKLRDGQPLEDYEVDILESLLYELEHLCTTEWSIADRALQEMAYYKRLAKIRKYK